MRRVVLDTNVLVSGNLSRLGPPGQIIDLVNDGALIPIYDSRIMVEYEAVLRRARFHFPAAVVSALLNNIRLSGVGTNAPPLPHLTLPDPTDLPFLEVAVVGAADYLVTGNVSHFCPGPRVTSGCGGVSASVHRPPGARSQDIMIRRGSTVLFYHGKNY